MQPASALEDIPILNEDESLHLDDLDALLGSPIDWGVEPLESTQLQHPLERNAPTPAPNSSGQSGGSNDHGQDTGQQRRVTKDDRRLAVGRETQKRFRLRQKLSRGFRSNS